MFATALFKKQKHNKNKNKEITKDNFKVYQTVAENKRGRNKSNHHHNKKKHKKGNSKSISISISRSRSRSNSFFLAKKEKINENEIFDNTIKHTKIIEKKEYWRICD